MGQKSTSPPRYYAYLVRLARALALTGGALFMLLALMTVTSVLGRALISYGYGPVPGDFELVETGCAVAVFCFLPWCQLQQGHVTVDVLTDAFPHTLKLVFIRIGNFALFITAVLIAWKLIVGLEDKWQNGEETWILGLKVWWGYAGSVLGALLFALCALHTVIYPETLNKEAH